MNRCAKCNLPEIAATTYGQFVSFLYDLYMAVKTSKGTEDATELFLAEIEIEFLLKEIMDMDRLDDAT